MLRELLLDNLVQEILGGFSLRLIDVQFFTGTYALVDAEAAGGMHEFGQV